MIKDQLWRFKVERPRKESELPRSFKTDSIKVAALFDSHYPYNINIRPFLNFLRDYQPDVFIFGGDNWSLDCISHWNEQDFRNIGFNNVLAKFNDEAQGFKDHVLSIREATPHAKMVYIMGNHECLDVETQLYTKRGWITYKQILPDDMVVSLNPETEILEWVPIDHIIIKKFKGELISLKTRGWDLLATEDHKIFTRNRVSGKYEYRPVSECLGGNRLQIPLSGTFKKKEYKLSDQMIKLAAWCITDSFINKSHGYIILYQRKSKSHLIKELLSAFKNNYTYQERDRDTKSICGKVLKKKPEVGCEFRFDYRLSRKMNRLINRKKQIPDWVFELSERQFDVFLGALVDADGSRHKTSADAMMFYKNDHEFRDRLQALCALNGYSCTEYFYRGNNYKLNINKRKTLSIDRKEITKVPYDDEVWDLTVKNHNFLIRRNGKPHFTGNCWLEQFTEKFPQMNRPTIPKILGDVGKDFEFIPQGGMYKIGKLNFAHGDQFGSQNPAKQAVERCHASVVFGHHHSHKVWPAFSMVNDEEKYLGIQVPCFTGRAPKYGKGMPNAWQNGFFTATIKKSGNFSPHVWLVSPKGHFIDPYGREYE